MDISDVSMFRSSLHTLHETKANKCVGGGMICALGIVLSLFERNKSNKGQVIDCGIYLTLLSHMINSDD